MTADITIAEAVAAVTRVAAVYDASFRREGYTPSYSGYSDASLGDNTMSEPIPILGPTRVKQIIAQEWALRHNAADVFVNTLIPLYWQIAPQYNLPAENAAMQSAHETGWAHFGGVLDTSFRNPAGIKIKSGGGNFDPNAHYRFPSWEAGVQAHCSHLSKYGGLSEAEMPTGHYRSPRLIHVTQGIAPNIRDLGGKYAPSPTYGLRLETNINDLLEFAETRNGQEQPVSVAEKYGIRGLIDSRQELRRSSSGGPTNRRSLSFKHGVVVHYAGGPQNHSLTDMQLWQAYAGWHIDKPTWGGPGTNIKGNGIMYHIGIGRDGSKHLLYDIEVDRWHCGSWPENGTHLSINLPIGGTQRATPNALQALREVVHDWIANGHGTRQMVIGHQEVDWTACPGTLMSDFVVPYRNQEAPVANYIHFPETGHGIGHGFLDFWQSKGGLMVFGYPLSDELDEEVMLEDRKKTVTVQYFERAVFEFHSDHQEPYRILLRRLGADALNRKRSA